MPPFARDFVIALLIGAEVFAIAALWPLSEWAVAARRGAGLVIALAVIGACVALTFLGLAPLGATDPWRSMLGHAAGWLPLPLFIGLPNAVCVASGQSLARAGVSARHARATALAVAGLALVVEPFATLVAGCGLAGACF